MTDEAEAPAANPNGGLRKKLLSGLGLVVVAGALIWGLWYYVTQKGRVHTDNAYVGADLALVHGNGGVLSAQATTILAGPAWTS